MVERATRRSWGWLPVFLLVGACAGHQDPAGDGEDCYRDSDCKAGLVCVADMAGLRRCSSDVSGLVSNVDAPPLPEDAGTMPEVDAGDMTMDAGDMTDPDAG